MKMNVSKSVKSVPSTKSVIQIIASGVYSYELVVDDKIRNQGKFTLTP